MRRLIYIGLFASLALNLFLVGVIVAGLFWHGGHHHRRGPFNIRHAYTVLTPASQAKAKTIWQAERAAFFAKIHEVRAARREVRALLREDKPDIGRMEAAIAKVGRIRREIHDTLRGIVKKIADALPAEERVRFYRAVLKRRGRFRRRRDG